MFSLGLHNGEVLQHPAAEGDPRGVDGCGHVAARAPALLHQVSCDWRRAGHVTTVLTSDWLQGRPPGAEGRRAAAHRQGGAAPGTPRLHQVSEETII